MLISPFIYPFPFSITYSNVINMESFVKEFSETIWISHTVYLEHAIWTDLTRMYEKIFIFTEFELKNNIDVQLCFTLDPFEAVIFILKT